MALYYGTSSFSTEASETTSKSSGSVQSPRSYSGLRVEENLVQINVYFNSLSEQIISAELVYPLWGSAITVAFGGVMSLYLGIPIAMLFELVEIFLDFIGNVINWSLGKPLGRKNLYF